MELSEEEKKAIEYLTKYIHWETYGERSLETDIKTVLNLLDKKQKEIKELKETNEDNAEKSLLNDIFIKKNYISKDKIREKIKEYQEKAEDVKQKYKGVYAYKDDYLEVLAKIEGYQELLEENNEESNTL